MYRCAPAGGVLNAASPNSVAQNVIKRATALFIIRMPMLKDLRMLPQCLVAFVMTASVGGMTAHAETEDASPSLASATIDFGLPAVDNIVVRKGERRLYLMRQGEVLRSYKVALGLAPVGHKQQEGDFRTPEGKYRLIRRNPRSEYFLSLEVSYPNEADVARAKQLGVSPGGLIMIHGLPNTPRKTLDYYRRTDWTDGCIAVSNSDMVEIWMMTPPNTPIEILP